MGITRIGLAFHHSNNKTSTAVRINSSDRDKAATTTTSKHTAAHPTAKSCRSSTTGGIGARIAIATEATPQ
jgi:hypothetical protein